MTSNVVTHNSTPVVVIDAPREGELVWFRSNEDATAGAVFEGRITNVKLDSITVTLTDSTEVWVLPLITGKVTFYRSYVKLLESEVQSLVRENRAYQEKYGPLN